MRQIKSFNVTEYGIFVIALDDTIWRWNDKLFEFIDVSLPGENGEDPISRVIEDAKETVAKAEKIAGIKVYPCLDMSKSEPTAAVIHKDEDCWVADKFWWPKCKLSYRCVNVKCVAEILGKKYLRAQTSSGDVFCSAKCFFQYKEDVNDRCELTPYKEG
jgi:hypothetical protein